MEAAQTIRNAVARVSRLRQSCEGRPELGQALVRIKQLQSLRFAGSYADMLGAGPYRAAARFFLDELYSDKDYSDRDAQFARIAGAIESLFPAQVARTAIALAELHELTEELDHAMASAWLNTGGEDSQRYVEAWQSVGRRPDRIRQLRVVLAVGQEMARLTRTPGLRLMLKLMRGPASAAQLQSLQRFLESGFDTFAAMAKQPQGPSFLQAIEQRESALIDMLFDAPLVASETEMARLLGQAR